MKATLSKNQQKRGRADVSASLNSRRQEMCVLCTSLPLRELASESVLAGTSALLVFAYLGKQSPG